MYLHIYLVQTGLKTCTYAQIRDIYDVFPEKKGIFTNQLLILTVYNSTGNLTGVCGCMSGCVTSY